MPKSEELTAFAAALAGATTYPALDEIRADLGEEALSICCTMANCVDACDEIETELYAAESLRDRNELLSAAYDALEGAK